MVVEAVLGGCTGGLRVGVDGPRNVLKVSVAVLVVLWTTEGMSGNVRRRMRVV